jgi:hypothetical protein
LGQEVGTRLGPLGLPLGFIWVHLVTLVHPWFTVVSLLVHVGFTLDSLGFTCLTWCHLVSFDFTRFRLVSLGFTGLTLFTWFHLASPGFTFIHSVSLGFNWFHLVCDLAWLHLVPRGDNLFHLVSLVPFWSHSGLFH